MHRWSARLQGNLDDRRGYLLSAGFDQFLDSTRALGIKSIAVSSRKRGDARSVRDSPLASSAPFADQWCVARCGDLGFASGPSRIGGVDHRIEKHAVLFVLSLVDLVLSEVA